MRKVQIIPQCQRPAVLLRTCGYARVSTDGEDQMESFVTQVEYYTTLIKKNPEWIYAGVYADEGITGTSAYRRDEFNRMIGDCRKGKIDLIITKSISRFARNTYECIQVIRELKQLGIGIYFEKEYIQSRLYLAQPLNIACFLLTTYHILWFCAIINQDLVSLVACLSLKSIK